MLHRGSECERMTFSHSGHWGITPPPPLPCHAPPPLNQQTVQARPRPFLGNPPLYINFSRLPPLKVRSFSEPQKCLKFFILNTILSSKSNLILG